MPNSRELTIKISADASNLTKPIRETIKSLKESSQLLEKTDGFSSLLDQLEKVEKQVETIEGSLKSLNSTSASSTAVEKLADSLKNVGDEVADLQKGLSSVEAILGGLSNISGVKGITEMIETLKTANNEAGKIVGTIDTAYSQLNSMATAMLKPSEILEKTLKTLNQELGGLTKKFRSIPSSANIFGKSTFDSDELEKGIKSLEAYKKAANSTRGITDDDNNNLLDLFKNDEIKTALGDYIDDLVSSITDIEETGDKVGAALDNVKKALREGAFSASDLKILDTDTKSKISEWLNDIAKLANIKELLNTLEGGATSVKDNIFTYLNEQLGLDSEDLLEAFNLYDKYSGSYLQHVKQDIAKKKKEIEKISKNDVTGYATSALFGFKNGGIKLKVDFSESTEQLAKRAKSIIDSINSSIKDTPVKIQIAEDPGSSVLVQYLMSESEAASDTYKKLVNKAVNQHKKKPETPNFSTKDLVSKVDSEEQQKAVNYNKELNSVLNDTLGEVEAIVNYLGDLKLSDKLNDFSEHLGKVSSLLGEIKDKIPEIGSAAADGIHEAEDSISGLHLKLAILYESFSDELKSDDKGAISLSGETEKIVKEWGETKAQLDAISGKETSLGALLYLDPQQDKATIDFLQKYVDLGKQVLENNKASVSNNSAQPIIQISDETVRNFQEINEAIKGISSDLPSTAQLLPNLFDAEKLANYSVTLDLVILKLERMMELTELQNSSPNKGNERSKYKSLSKDIEDAIRARNSAFLKREKIKEAYNTENTKLYGKNWRRVGGHLNATDDPEYKVYDAEYKKQNKRVSRYSQKRSDLVSKSAWLANDKMVEEQEKKEIKLEEKFQTNVESVRAKGASDIIENERKKNEALAAEQKKALETQQKEEEKARKKQAQEAAKKTAQEQKNQKKQRTQAFTTDFNKNISALEKEYKLKADLEKIEASIDGKNGGVKQSDDVYSDSVAWIKKKNELEKNAEKVDELVSLLQSTSDIELFNTYQARLQTVVEQGNNLLSAAAQERKLLVEELFQSDLSSKLAAGDSYLNDFNSQITSIERYQAALEGVRKSKKEYEEVESGEGYVVANITEQSGAIAKVRYEWEQTTGSVKAYTLSVEKSKPYSWGDALKDTGASITKVIGAGFTLSRVFGQVDNLFRSGRDAVLEYNKALTNISYTMDLTKDQLGDLGQATVNMARDLRVSINDALAISQIYANMQSTPEEIVNTGMPTAILANLAGENASTAANQIQSVMQQFNMTDADSMHIADVYDYISANIKMDYAKGIEVIAAGVEAAGQTAQEAGMSFEQLAAVVAKMTERTREDGGSIGNALKTIMVRLSKASTMSDEVDNDTLSKASAALSEIGIKVYEATGEYRQFDVIMGELADKWDSLTDAQRANISYQVAA